MKKPQRMTLRVSLDIPDGATKTMMRDYVLADICEMPGCKHPEDPIFHLDVDSVKVAFMRKKPS